MGGGTGGGSPTIPQSPSDKAQAKILEALEKSVGVPIRNAVVPQALQTLGGPGVYQTELPATDRGTIEGQYSQARNQILNTGTRGGQLQSRLADLSRDRANAVSGATIDARQRGIERALGLVPAAIPNAGQQMSTRSALGSNEQNRLNTIAQMNAQASQSQGAGIGSLLGAGLGLLPISG
jgi:hypothetical protein